MKCCKISFVFTNINKDYFDSFFESRFKVGHVLATTLSAVVYLHLKGRKMSEFPNLRPELKICAGFHHLSKQQYSVRIGPTSGCGR